ncbi:MAG: phage tail spike protein [Lachnospiraceae bacterium]|nr:phage tail spike protein [Lachnospiraceae bacterium]
MIQVYDPGNTDYTKNGNMTLMPSVASVHAILGGMWEATLSHPLDTLGRWKHLTEEAVVKMPSFNGNQLFRIRKAEKSDSGVYCLMDPIFYDCRDEVFFTDVRPENKNGQQALNILCTGKYSGQSDILTSRTAYYIYKNLLEALVGDEDNSFVNRWGGEPIFDNYNIVINARAGSDYNVEIRYGKNIPKDGMTVSVDMSEIVTRIYPKAYNGYEMSNHGYVDSPFIATYAKTYARTIQYDDVKMREDEAEGDSEAGVTVCDTQAQLDAALLAKCYADYDAGIDRPLVTIEADLILLQNMEQYADIAKLETVSLGDTVHCYNSHLGYSTNARVMELTYDSIKKRVEAVTLGAYRQTYFDKLRKGISGIDALAERANSVLHGDGTVMAERIKGFLNGAMTSLRAQYNIAEHMDYLAILFENLDPTSDLYGALAIGTQGFMISKQRNAAGTDWVWTTVGTAAGLVADTIVTGALSDASGYNSWDLDTGVLNMARGSINIGNVFIVDSDGNLTAESATVAGTLISDDLLERIIIAQALIRGYHRASVNTPWSESTLTGTLDLAADYDNGNGGTVYEVALASGRNIHIKVPRNNATIFEVEDGNGGSVVTAEVTKNGVSAVLHHTGGANDIVCLPSSISAYGQVMAWSQYRIKDGVIEGPIASGYASQESGSGGGSGGTWPTVNTNPQTGNEEIESEDGSGNTVVTPVPSAIEIVTPPTKTSYIDGETMIYSGIEVGLRKKDGSLFTDSRYQDGTLHMNNLRFPVSIAEITEHTQVHELQGYTNSGTVTVTAVGSILLAIDEAIAKSPLTWYGVQAMKNMVAQYDGVYPGIVEVGLGTNASTYPSVGGFLVYVLPYGVVGNTVKLGGTLDTNKFAKFYSCRVSRDGDTMTVSNVTFEGDNYLVEWFVGDYTSNNKYHISTLNAEIALAQSEQVHIPVQWVSTYDGRTFEDTFDITVSNFE